MALVNNESPSGVAVAQEVQEAAKKVMNNGINLENQLQQQILDAVPTLYLKALASLVANSLE